MAWTRHPHPEEGNGGKGEGGMMVMGGSIHDRHTENFKRGSDKGIALKHSPVSARMQNPPMFHLTALKWEAQGCGSTHCNERPGAFT